MQGYAATHTDSLQRHNTLMEWTLEVFKADVRPVQNIYIIQPSAKGHLLGYKSIPFTRQKDAKRSAKGRILQNERKPAFSETDINRKMKRQKAMNINKKSASFNDALNIMQQAVKSVNKRCSRASYVYADKRPVCFSINVSAVKPQLFAVFQFAYND